MTGDVCERRPCPISSVIVSLERPNIRVLCLQDEGTEQEANRILRYWSQQLAPDESLDVCLDVAFTNGFRVQTRHHLRTGYPDGTVRNHVLERITHQGNCAIHGQGGDWWSAPSLARALQGWPPQADASASLREWASNRQTSVDLSGAFGQAQAEYCAALLRLLDLDHPVMEIPDLARCHLAWNEQDSGWLRGLDGAQHQARNLVHRYLKSKENPP